MKANLSKIEEVVIIDKEGKKSRIEQPGFILKYGGILDKTILEIYDQ